MTDGIKSHVAFTFPSTLACVHTVEDTALEFAQAAGFDHKTASNLAMVAREAAVNAVIHGNRRSETKQVSASFEITPAALTIKIADQGAGFDVDAIPNPLDPQNLLRPSGRGVFLMRAFMDEVHFRLTHPGTENPGTEITLTKRRPQSTA